MSAPSAPPALSGAAQVQADALKAIVASERPLAHTRADSADAMLLLGRSRLETQVPGIDLRGVLQEGAKGGGGQSPGPGNNAFGSELRDESESDKDAHNLNSWGLNLAYQTPWQAGLTPAAGADFNREGTLTIDDVRVALKAYRDKETTPDRTADGLAKIPPTNLMDSPGDWRNKSSQRGDSSSYVNGLPVRPIDPAQQSVLIVAAAQLAESGRVDEAKRLLCSNLNLDQSNVAQSSTAAQRNIAANVQQNAFQPPADRLCGALNSTLPESERLAAIHEASKAAADDLLERRRASILLRKLAPDAMIQTPTAARYRAAADQTSAKPDEASKDEPTNKKKLHSGSGFILLTILLADTSTKTLDILKALGLKIEALRPEASVVIARVPLDKLEELALMDAVKRIELVPMDGATVK